MCVERERGKCREKEREREGWRVLHSGGGGEELEKERSTKIHVERERAKREEREEERSSFFPFVYSLSVSLSLAFFLFFLSHYINSEVEKVRTFSRSFAAWRPSLREAYFYYYLTKLYNFRLLKNEKINFLKKKKEMKNKSINQSIISVFAFVSPSFS